MRLIRVTQALSDTVDALTRWMAVPIVAAYTLLTFSGVIARFVLKTPIMEAVLYSRLGFVWSCLLGAALAYKRSRHIRFTAIAGLLPGRLGNAGRLGIDCLTLGFLVWILFYAVAITRRVWPSTISGTDLSNGFMYLALPIALFAMILHCLNNIAHGIANFNAPTECGK